MASRSVSPGGALLRASRVFSIPPPLPRPAGELSSQSVFNSNTATLPYPTHQTITTPETSRLKGDWGFKRPLPLRSTTKTSTPLIRVEAIDTFEHITEFASAADHSVNLRKWHEMGIPLSTPGIKQDRVYTNVHGPQKSVFEDELDYTTPVEEAVGLEEVRWKFKGPWLAGQSEGDFNTYLHKEVLPRKTELREFIREECAKVITRKAHRLATERGETIPPSIQASDVSDEEFAGFVRILRHDDTSLYKMIRKFLDLPPAPSSDAADGINDLLNDITGKAVPPGRNRRGMDKFKKSSSPYAESGPPKTHPSAGLSYLRTYSHTFNHPLYGPQKKKPPVKARIVMPKGASTGSFPPALGVGGFVTDVPFESDSFKTRGVSRGSKTGAPQPQPIAGLLNIEPDRVGGSKTYVELKHASIDAKGRVILRVDAGDEEARAIKEGLVHEIPRRVVRPVMKPERPKQSTGSYNDDGYGLNSVRSVQSQRGEPSRRKLDEIDDGLEFSRLLKLSS